MRKQLRSLSLAALISLLAGCAAALSALDAAAPGLVGIIEAEAKQAGVPPTDPAYQAALKAAQALEKERATSAADQRKRIDAIVAQMKKDRAACAKPSASAAPAASTPAVFPSLPPAPSVLPVVVVDAGSTDAGR